MIQNSKFAAHALFRAQLLTLLFFCSCISDLGNIPTNLNTPAVIVPTIIKPITQDNSESDRKMSPDGTRKLQDEINMLTKRNCELESQLRSLESSSKELMHIDNNESVEAAKVKELEKLVKILKQEKEEALKEKQDYQEKLKLQDKELKDALSQRKLAMAEYTEVSDRLSELRNQKQKLSRQVRTVFFYQILATPFFFEGQQPNFALDY